MLPTQSKKKEILFRKLRLKLKWEYCIILMLNERQLKEIGNEKFVLDNSL